MKTLIAALFATTALAASVQASAAQDDNYVGAAIGARTHYGLDCTTGIRCDRNTGGGKIYFGKQLEKNFAAEVMAFRLGHAHGALKNGSTTVAGSARAQGLAATGVFSAPLGDAFSLKGRLGVGYVRGEADYAAGGGTSKSSFVPVIGVGASYALNQKVSLNADWDRLPAKFGSSGKATTNMLSLGMSFRF